MKDRPTGLADGELRAALADGWQIRATSMRYAPVGGGSYHWVVRDSHRARWFVTVDDLDSKSWLGDTRPTVLAGLRAAMDTALALRSRAGLDFVVAPVPAGDATAPGSDTTGGFRAIGGSGVPPGQQSGPTGQRRAPSTGTTTRPLGSRYAVTLFRYLDGISGRWGEPLPAPERAELVRMLAALHRSAPTAALARGDTPRRVIGQPWRGALEKALGELRRPWAGGPFAEPARALLAGAARQVRSRLAEFDELASRVAANAAAPVITHGEPHPGNVIRTGGKLLLIDWDTVALAPPERDLWLVASENGDELRRYRDATGRAADPAALALYRLRWTLDDLSAFTRQLRSAHGHTPGAEHAWQCLNQVISAACRGAAEHGSATGTWDHQGRAPLTSL